MSLKTFHIIFIGSAFLLAVFLGVWGIVEFFTRSHSIFDLVLGVLSLAGAAGLIVYGRYFLKKLRNIDYL
jgi:hypothetical protein